MWTAISLFSMVFWKIWQMFLYSTHLALFGAKYLMMADVDEQKVHLELLF